jgi:hypothetical protein
VAEKAVERLRKPEDGAARMGILAKRRLLLNVGTKVFTAWRRKLSC